MRIFSSNMKGLAWGALACATFFTVAAILSPSQGYILFAVLCAAMGICLFYLEKEEQRRDALSALRRQRMRERECMAFTMQESALRANLAAGKLRILAEWWEPDEVYIDENAHMLFVFTDDTEMDFVLHPPIVEKLRSLLAEYGMEWDTSL